MSHEHHNVHREKQDDERALLDFALGMMVTEKSDGMKGVKFCNDSSRCIVATATPFTCQR